jgi:uncharacterized protein (DUF2267 family)
MARAMHAFDGELHEANVWLKEVASCLENSADLNPYGSKRVLRAVLHALRDRIGPDNAVHLGAQLPTLVRGLYYDGWRPSMTPTRERGVDDFLSRVDDQLGRGAPIDPEAATCAVFEVLWSRLDPGEVEKVRELLPLEFDDLWPGDVVRDARRRAEHAYRRDVGVHQPMRRDYASA